jgi:hypothetical protein
VSPRRCGGLLVLRPCWVPTWRAWLLAGLLLSGSALVLLFGAYPFLCLSTPHPDGPVVFEGWAGPECLAEAITEHQQHGSRVLFCTGGPIEKGSILERYGSYAELAAENAVELGLSRAEVMAVPAPKTKRDRTYASAVALRRWFEARGAMPPHITLVSHSVHTRRSRDLFQRAFGKQTQVGAIAIPEKDFDAGNWYTSAAGFRVVTGEIIAYAYATLFFWQREP